MESLSKSVETEGGKILVIVFMLIFIVITILVLAETHHPLQEAGKELATGAVTSLLTLLYQYLAKK